MTTPRLTLGPLTAADAPFLLELLNTPGWLRFIGDRQVRNLEDAQAYIEKILADPNVHYWMVRLREEHTTIGVISLIKRENLPDPDLGFAFLPQFAGKGYAYEAAAAVRDRLGEDGAHRRLLAIVLKDNRGSIRLLEKLGFEPAQEVGPAEPNSLLFSLNFSERGRMRISTRLLAPPDAVAYRALRLRSFREAPLAFSESYEDERRRPESDFAAELEVRGEPAEWFVLGAVKMCHILRCDTSLRPTKEDELVGFVKFRRDQRSKARHKAMLHAMYVAPEYRKLGVGRQLVLDLLERARQLPELEQIHCWVLHADGSAADFYRKLGFESQGPLVRKDLKIEGRYVDAEYLVLYLE